VLDADILVLGVLKFCDGEFVASIKQREDVLVFEVTRENRDTLEAVITPLLPHRQA
jgi:nucleoside-triphosphatase THEP1